MKDKVGNSAREVSTTRYPFFASIRGKHFLLLLSVLIPVLLVQTVYIYNRFKERVASQSSANLELARAVGATFHNFIADIIHHELAIGAGFTLPHPLSAAEMNRMLALNKKEFPAVHSFLWLDPGGRVIASSLGSAVGLDLYDRDYVHELLSGKQWVVGHLIHSRVTGQPTFTVSRAIRGEKGNLLGIVAAAIQPEKLRDILSLHLPSDETITIIDNQGNAVYRESESERKTQRKLLKDSPAIQEALEGREVSGVFRNRDTGEAQIVAIVPISSIGWAASVDRSRQAVVAPIVAHLLHGAVLFFLVMVAVFILGFVFSERISRPIRRLLEHTLALGGGDGKEPIAETGPAELKGLAVAFNVMAEKVGAREKALVRAQQRLISVLESIPASVYIQDRDCSIRFANRTFRETFGEPGGKRCYELLQGRSESCENCDVVRTLNTQTPQQWEWTDPVGRCYSIYSHPFTDSDGVPVVLKLVVDISERKRAWQAFLDSEKRYRELVQNANSAIIRMNKDGSITFFNEYAQSFFGYTEEEVLGKHVGILLPEKETDGTDLTKLAENVLSRPEHYAYSVNENIRRDGSRVWMAWTNKPIFDESGNVVEVLSVGIDISDRKRAVDALRNEVLERKQIEARLRLDEARLEALWRLSQMSESSVDRIAEFALEQLVRLTGSQTGWIGLLDEAQTVLTFYVWPKSLAGKEPSLKIPVGGTDIFGEAVREKRVVVINDFRDVVLGDFLESRALVDRILVVPVCEKGRVVAIAGVGNKAANYELSDAREITLLMDGMWKILQREKAEKRLRDAESLAAMGRAMAAVAHDMKTPLIAIGGFSRLAQKRIGEDAPVQELLEIVVKETARMESMVKDMLDFSRPLDLEFSKVDIVLLVAESLAIVAPIARAKRVTLRNRIDSGSGLTAWVDFGRMKQALINILTNAVEASREGQEVSIGAHVKGESFVLSVVDSGCGIPKGKREEIFSPFYTSKKDGTGLGLPIVKKIIDAHRGRIEIIDNQDKGITFRVEIPLRKVA